ncbi:LysM peptidoglycan-binding domain-containing protein [Iocasia frigidifontis]|uniref:LysM peptidoglycan-binding domain-containing protein n=2 Tax=Iocasia fonsfrigidae TaxID=2682810 RepID=A0A8A7KKK2_9FIRM|nr:LysM peptidoglycan-binding domain-containing protein [Bacillota bacterium]QTL98382.1 LysM peptidoglycan-binding domain-containing protein [Iocasia fonsfrigidae]
MMNSLEIANRIYSMERRLDSLYNQLEDSFSSPRYIRTAQNLRNLQARQLSILNGLIAELEEEQPPPPVNRYYAQHILQPGETLRVLALEYDTTVSQIRRLNPGLPDEPQAGQLVNLPIEIPRPPENSIRYVVKPGDTLFQIARRFGTDVSTLVRLNSIADPDIIFPGRILIIPNPV